MGTNSSQGSALLLFLSAFVPIAVGMAGGTPLLAVFGLLLLAASGAALKRVKDCEAPEE
jgi:hypothetical protein